ncbi:MAG: alpha/beta hydrolase [Chryseobacterium sp.]|nr:MAG: alpha/beta hydrolase [Chryseobacterium sp.]
MSNPYTTPELFKLLPGFFSHNVEVNNTRLHYVTGGAGQPLILIPGYPETWWSCHQIMPLLSAHFKVYVVEMRGMGDSEKPADGYDKQNMAKDIFELVQLLDLGKIYIAGQDIGAHVAYSFAANFSQAAEKLILLDTPHPEEGMYRLPMLPIPGADYVYPFWLALNQIKQLPEQLMEGRMHLLIDWMFEKLLVQKDTVTEFDLAVYAHHYNNAEAIRASNGWYQAFAKDIEDFKHYDELKLPVLAIGGSGYEVLKQGLTGAVHNVKLINMKDCGHFLLPEKPAECALELIDFLC